MIDLRQAAQQAIEALDSDNPDIQLRAAVTLRAAMELPVQEPVAWMVWGYNNVPSLTFTKPADKYVFDSLYTAPPQRQWVGLTDEEIETTLSQLWCDINIMKFMTCDRPQQETVVFILSRAIEAKLKERNT